MGTNSSIISSILQARNPDIKLHGFRAAITRDVFTNDDREELGLDRKWITIIPDAYIIDGENRIVIMIEIVDRNPVTINKLGRISDFWWVLDEVYWDAILATVDSQLNITVYPPEILCLAGVKDELLGAKYARDLYCDYIRDVMGGSFGPPDVWWQYQQKMRSFILGDRQEAI